MILSNPGFPDGSAVEKQSAYNAKDTGDAGLTLGGEDPLEESIATHFSVFAWRIPQTEEPAGLQFIGLQRVGHN